MRRILVWDTPNMDMALGQILGRTPIATERPNMGSVINWFVGRCGEDEPIACIFVNIPPGEVSNPKFHGWLRYLSTQGFSIFAKPKGANGDGDIDDDMLRFIRDRRGDDTAEVIVASHDAACFNDLIGELTAAGVKSTVVGYSELVNGYDLSGKQAGFIELEAIPGVFAHSLPRHINIWHLPADGIFFEASGKPARNSRSNRSPARRVNPRKSAAAQDLIDQA